jgi:spore coat polysaccharide biosynthesis protein SpsF
MKIPRRAVFLQVRLSSTRLPRKALLPLSGMTVIEHAMRALGRIPVDVYALLTDHESAASLEPLAAGCGFTVFAGDPDDVLARYAAAARHFRIDRYFRATGDNPLVSAPLAVELERRHVAAGADFSGFLGPPLGTGVEIVEAHALLAADREATDPYEREHVSPFIYRRPERFRVLRPWADDEVLLPDALVTLDTQEDYELLERIYCDLYRGAPIETPELVRWLKAHGHVKSRHAERHLLPCNKAG